MSCTLIKLMLTVYKGAKELNFLHFFDNLI